MWLFSLSACAAGLAGSTSGLPPDASISAGLTALWVTVSGTATRRQRSWRGWTTRPWSERLFFAETSPTWMPSLCGDSPIALSPVFPASRGAPPASSKAQATIDGCGRLSRESSKRYGPSSSFSKTFLDSAQAAYLAGLIDGEGSILPQKTGDVFNARVSIKMSEKAAPILKDLHSHYGGNYRKDKDETQKDAAVFSWTVAGRTAVPVILDVLPFLRLKQRQAELALKLETIRADAPRHQGTHLRQETKDQIAELANEMRRLNARGPMTPHFPSGCLAVFFRGQLVTPQRNLFGQDYRLFSGALPASGSLRNGAIYRQPKLELHTKEKECSSWPTARSHEVGDYQNQVSGPPIRTLTGVARQWPSPTANPATYTAGNSPGYQCLPGMAQTWPTPRSEDSESCGNHPNQTDSLTGATALWGTPRVTTSGMNGAERENDKSRLEDQAFMWATPRANERQQKNSQDDYQAISKQAELWATPNAMAGGSTSRDGDRIGEALLGGQVQMWSTPTASDDKRGTSPYSEAEINRPQGKPMTLAKDVAGWPTPNARDHKGTDLASRNGGASLSHATETGQFSHQDQPTPAGQQSSSNRRTSRRRLNPAFTCWLMGSPWFWTRAEPISFAAREMELYRCKLRRLLSSLFGER